MESLTLCKYCEKIYVNPFVLACCDEAICKNDLDELFLNKNEKNVKCPFDDHEIELPKSISETNKDKDEIRGTIINEDSDSHLKESINLFIEKVNEYELLIKNPEKHINDYFNNIQAKLNSKTRELIDEIINYNEKTLAQLNDLKENCINKIKDSFLDEDIVEMRETWSREIQKIKSDNQSSLELDPKTVSSKTEEIDLIIKKLKSELVDYNLRIFKPVDVRLLMGLIIGALPKGKMKPEEIFDNRQEFNYKSNQETFNQYRKVDNFDQRLELTFAEHLNSVYSLIPLPNGDLASACWDTTIKIWDTSIKTVRFTLKAHLEFPNSFAVFKNGDLANNSCDFSIKIWNTSTGELKFNLEGHRYKVYPLVILSNGDLASGSFDRTIKIWNATNGKLKYTLEGHSDSVHSLAVLKDDNIASGSKDKNIIIWDIHREQIKFTLKGHSSIIDTLVVLKNNDLASGSLDKIIKIWDTDSGVLKYTFEPDSYSSLLIELQNGDLVSDSEENSLKIWDTCNGNLKFKLEGHLDRISSLALLPNGDLASCSWDASIKIWDTLNGSLKETFDDNSKMNKRLAVLPNGNLVSASVDRSIKIWNL